MHLFLDKQTSPYSWFKHSLTFKLGGSCMRPSPHVFISDFTGRHWLLKGEIGTVYFAIIIARVGALNLLVVPGSSEEHVGAGIAKSS
jgi:hypothetical protein